MVMVRSINIRSSEFAREEMSRIGVDPIGTALMLPKQFHYNLKLSGLTPPQANILKQEVLAVGGEAAVSKGVVSCKVEQTDAILSATVKQYQRLIKKLRSQPYGLGDLSIELASVLSNLDTANALRFFKGRTRSWDISKCTLVMGVLNLTPDSFSDGGAYKDTASAVARAKEMMEEGADIIDVGGESSRPGAKAVSAAEELGRIIDVVEELSAAGIPVSVDTVKSEVAARAIEAGAEVINDISALTSDEKMASVVSEGQAGLILMHMRGTPETMQDDIAYDDLMGELFKHLKERIEFAEATGIELDKIAIDPGLGFSKSMEANLEILGRLSELRALGRPILIGASRKSFIGKATGKDVAERLSGTLAAISAAVLGGARIIRAHDVSETVEAIKVLDAIRAE
jgi:dihydropteroate synthase